MVSHDLENSYEYLMSVVRAPKKEAPKAEQIFDGYKPPKRKL